MLTLLGGRFARAQDPSATPPASTEAPPGTAPVTAPPASQEAPLFTFAMASDSHIGNDKKTGKFLRQWEQAVDEIKAYDPAFVLFLGDLVDSGQVPENQQHYPTWLTLAKKLEKPLVCVPGNHDPVEMFTQHIQKETDTVHDHKDHLRVIAFHDAQLNPKHDGTITPAQIAWMDKMIAEAPGSGKNVILASHVVFHKNLPPDRAWYVKEGREAFEALVKKHQSRLFAMYSGHFHNGIRGWDDLGIHEVMMPATCYNQKRFKGEITTLQQWIEKGGGFVLDEFRPGWVQTEVYPNRMILKYKPLGATSDAQKLLS